MLYETKSGYIGQLVTVTPPFQMANTGIFLGDCKTGYFYNNIAQYNNKINMGKKSCKILR